MHDGLTNNISFQHHDQKIILKPLSPREVCDDQIKMREKRKKRVRNHRGIGKRRGGDVVVVEVWEFVGGLV